MGKGTPRTVKPQKAKRSAAPVQPEPQAEQRAGFLSRRPSGTVILTGRLYSHERMKARWICGRVFRVSRLGTAGRASAEVDWNEWMEGGAYMGWLP